MNRRQKNFKNRPKREIPLPTFGVWHVTERSPNDDWKLEINRDYGYFEGHLDDICFHFEPGDRTILNFELATAPVDNVKPISSTDGEDIFAAFQLMHEGKLIEVDTPSLRLFLKDRPVHVSFSTWGNCGLVVGSTSGEGFYRAQEASALDALIEKLTPQELQLLSQRGFKRYPESDYCDDYVRGSD